MRQANWYAKIMVKIHFSLKKKSNVRSGIRTHAYEGLGALDRSAILTRHETGKLVGKKYG